MGTSRGLLVIYAGSAVGFDLTSGGDALLSAGIGVGTDTVSTVISIS